MANVTRFCTQCGSPIPNISQRFCVSCGAEIPSDVQSSQTWLEVRFRNPAIILKTWLNPVSNWWGSLSTKWQIGLIVAILPFLYLLVIGIGFAELYISRALR
jgi:hypothetical protein